MLREFLSRIANAIRTALGTTDTINAQSFPDKISEVYEAGKNNERLKLWNVLQNNGEPRIFQYAFAYVWTDEIYNPIYDLEGPRFNNTFFGSKITDTKVSIKPTNDEMQGTFGSSSIEVVRKLILNENIKYSIIFNNCSNLRELTIEGTIGQNGFSVEHSTLLSKDSITSIINALSTTTSNLTITLSKTAVNNAFETSSGAGDGSTSEEWNTLIATKSNWSISLV